jgi:hypothetical protein
MFPQAVLATDHAMVMVGGHLLVRANRNLHFYKLSSGCLYSYLTEKTSERSSSIKTEDQKTKKEKELSSVLTRSH